MLHKILIIEDHDDTAATVQAILSRAGYECELAASGKEGLQKFGAGRFSLVIVDIGMAEMTGYEVAEEIRKSDAETPILAATGYDEFLVKPMARRVGINHVIPKPIDHAVMLEWVKFLCARRSGKEYVKSGQFKLVKQEVEHD